MAATGNLKRPYPAGGEQAQAPGAGQGQGQGQSRSRAADHAVLDGKRMRKPVHRQRVDYSSPVVLYVLSRMWQRDARDAAINLEATPSAGVNMLPPLAYPDWPASSFTTKFVHASINKARCSVNRVLWTPAGRERVFTGCQSGEFTLWNGQSFNFEWILQAHDVAVRSMVWSYNGNWLITGDDGGCVKYWTPTLNLIKAIHSAHKNSAVRDLSFSSTDLKFCSCSDDSVIKIWDFARCDEEERACKGHNWDVKSCAWHPQKSLIVSGGKDALVKLWDARTGKDLHTIEAHKAAVLKVKWNNNGNWVLTGSKDQAIKLFDIRTLKEMESYHGQKRDVTALAWHPFHEELFVSGGYDGSILYWLVGYGTPQAEVASAHEGSVWDLAWHPMGHLLCSGSQDQTTKFWCRHKPGEVTQAGKYGSGQKGHVAHEDYSSGGVRAFVDGASKPLGNGPADVIPGVGNMSMPLVQAGSDATWARTVETHNFQHQPFFAQPGAQPQTMLPAGVSSVSQPPLLARPSLATVPVMAAGGLQANHLQMSGSLNMGSAYQVGQLRGSGVVGQSQNLHPGQGQLMGYGGTNFAGGGHGQQGGPVQQVNWQIGGGGSLMQSNSQGLLPEQNTGHAVGSGLANLFNTF